MSEIEPPIEPQGGAVQPGEDVPPPPPSHMELLIATMKDVKAALDKQDGTLKVIEQKLTSIDAKTVLNP